jgi:hypothetical protein
MGYIETVTDHVFPYNARIFGYDWAKIEDPYEIYLSNHSKIDQLY